jgi:hypothetical protein
MVYFTSIAQTFEKGRLIYANALASTADTAGWVMEGPGKVEFSEGRMHMYSQKEKGHTVFWCPVNFPANFIAEWEVQNLHTDAGLCIVFFSALSTDGEDILISKLPKRTGRFKQYTNGAINNYHISYYANSKNEKGRETANLRKNKGFHKVQQGQPGIPLQSTAVHKIKLVKHDGRILLYIDEREVINWKDDGKQFGKVLQGGKIGFRQMKWTRFAYSNFKVWECVSQ